MKESINNTIRNVEIKTKEDETNYIIQLQEKEEELIESKKLCPYCKALNSIEDDICQACKKSIN